MCAHIYKHTCIYTIHTGRIDSKTMKFITYKHGVKGIWEEMTLDWIHYYFCVTSTSGNMLMFYIFKKIKLYLKIWEEGSWN